MSLIARIIGWTSKKKEDEIKAKADAPIYKITEFVTRKKSTFRIYEIYGRNWYDYRTERDTLEEARKVVKDWTEARRDAIVIKTINHPIE